MSVSGPTPSAAFTIICLRCDRPVTVHSASVGREVQCPHCSSIIRVPEPSPDGRPARAQAPTLTPQRSFNFACTRCDSLLEAHTGLSGQPGHCPTCGVKFTIPFLNPRTGIPDRVVIEPDGQNPTPIHAYAASGQQAPTIEREADGSLSILCPRCGGRSAIEENNCPRCGVPFSIDGAPTGHSAESDSRATAALVLGILSIPLFFLLIPALLAVIFGLLSMRGTLPIRGLVGLILGGVCLILFALVLLL